MRRAASVDGNQPAIFNMARKLGFSVADTSRLGEGFPDATLGRSGLNFLIEIKDDSLPPSRRKLTPSEAKWHEKWKGQVCVIESADDLLALHEYALNLAATVCPTTYAEGMPPNITARAKKKQGIEA